MNWGFVVAGLIMTAVLGSIFGIVAWNNSHTLTGKVLAVVLAFVVGFGFTALIVSGHNQDVARYNDGVCINCGGEYRFSGATRTRTSHDYFYTCQDCGHTIKTESLME